MPTVLPRFLSFGLGAVVVLALGMPWLHGAAVGQTAPVIAKIDPPNWFASMPDPMLLIKGTGLRNATFSVTGPPVRVVRTLTSLNGHWAMVWLDTHAATAETVHLTAHTADGDTRFDYTLKPRRDAGDGMAGLTPSDVLYCIMPDRFADGDLGNDPPARSPGTYDRSKPRAYHGGDLRGVIDHLDYLQQLGVTAVWLTPILENDPRGTDYHGYGATNLYAVDPHLGSLADYQELANQLHRRHMKLVFDDVPNHVGQHNPWVADPPLPDWFHGTEAKHLESNADFDPITDPHAPPRASDAALNGWFVNVLPDMNQQNPVVAQYLTENMTWWIEESGIDALRIDTFPYVQRAFWQTYLGALTKLFPRLTSVGEVSGSDPTLNAFFAGGRTLEGVDTHLDTPLDYPLHHALREALLNGKPMSHLEEILRQDWLYPHPERLVTFLGNHDVPRFLSEPNATPALMRLGVGLVMTLRGSPQLYTGDEIGMLGGEDPDNRRDFPGGFPGDAKNAFTAAGRTAAQSEMHDWVASLGNLRMQSPALQQGRQQTLFADESAFAFVRSTESAACPAARGSESMLVAVNRAASSRTLRLPLAETALGSCRALTRVVGQDVAPPATDRTAFSITLPAFGMAIYELR